MAESLSEQGITRVYVVRRGGVEIDAPVERVWPKLLDYASWQNYSIVQHISGEPGGEGEVVMLKKEEQGSSSTPYYARTIAIEPERRMIWKTFREGSDYFGIVEFEIEDIGGRTQFSYRNLYEHVLPTTDPTEVAAFREEREASITSLTGTIFPRLKQLVESEYATSGA